LVVCEWGRLVWSADKPGRCPRQAVRRLIIHQHGTPMKRAQLCALHLALVNMQPDEHIDLGPA
jgi:hypothetical protein